MAETMTPQAAAGAREVAALADHLERWASRQSWWDGRQYGTRMYFGDGPVDYVQRGLLQNAIAELRKHAARLAAPQPVAITGDDAKTLVTLASEIRSGSYNRLLQFAEEVAATLDRAAARLSVHAQAPAAPLTHDRAIAAAYRHVVDMIDASTDTEPDVALLKLRRYFDLLADTHRDAAPQPVAPAAPVVVPVEVTEDDFDAATEAENNEMEWSNARGAAFLNARLRARAADVVACRVVRRPVEAVSTIKTPAECGVTDGLIVVDWSGEKRSQFMAVGNWIIAQDCHRWCVPGQPWVERTPQPTARGWRAGDVPEGLVVVYCADGDVLVYTHLESREYVAERANKWKAGTIVVLPAAVGASQ